MKTSSFAPLHFVELICFDDSVAISDNRQNTFFALSILLEHLRAFIRLLVSLCLFMIIS